MGLGIDFRNRVWNWVAGLHRLAGRYDNPMPTRFLIVSDSEYFIKYYRLQSGLDPVVGVLDEPYSAQPAPPLIYKTSYSFPLLYAGMISVWEIPAGAVWAETVSACAQLCQPTRTPAARSAFTSPGARAISAVSLALKWLFLTNAKQIFRHMELSNTIFCRGLLRLKSLSGFLPSFFLSTKWYS